jgi:hypothetical protein
LSLTFWYSITTNLLTFYFFNITNFFKKVFHFLIFFVILSTLINITLELAIFSKFDPSHEVHLNFQVATSSLKLDLLYNFVTNGVNGDLKNFFLLTKLGILQQQFLFIYPLLEAVIITLEHSTLLLISYICLSTLLYVTYLTTIIIF